MNKSLKIVLLWRQAWTSKIAVIVRTRALASPLIGVSRSLGMKDYNGRDVGEAGEKGFGRVEDPHDLHFRRRLGACITISSCVAATFIICSL